MKSFASIVAALLAVNAAVTQEQSIAPISLWPSAAPGDTGDLGEEKDMTKPKDGKVADKPVIRLGNVSKPTITFYPAPKEKNTGTTVVVCPGGGYNILAMDLEGTEICEWFNSIGVNGVLLKYRVPARKGRPRHEAPVQDAQRAFGLVRQRAQEWGIDPNRIGVLGFSAGAHLAATLCANNEKRAYDPIDAADQLICRPDFAFLIYPAYLTLEKEGYKLAPEIPVTAQTPPTFIMQTQDDGIKVENSLYYYLALKTAKVPAELHVYPSGGHGYGLRPSSKMVSTWPKRAEDWLRGRGMLSTEKK